MTKRFYIDIKQDLKKIANINMSKSKYSIIKSIK